MAGLLPQPGLIIPYFYLWRREHEAGEESGRKARPVMVVISDDAAGRRRVAVAPVTSREPDATRRAVEIPRRVLTHLGLPARRSWVICDEFNAFDWPGPDVHVTPEGKPSFGHVPGAFIERIRAEMRTARDHGALKSVPRSE